MAREAGPQGKKRTFSKSEDGGKKKFGGKEGGKPFKKRDAKGDGKKKFGAKKDTQDEK